MMADIILADDCDLQRELLAAALSRSGHGVRTVKNGNEALAQYNRAPSDLIITDIFMPEKDGIELLLAVRRAGQAVPVIVMTAGFRAQQDIYLKMAKALGASVLLRKPVLPEALIEAVDTALVLGPGPTIADYTSG
jgi:CheY-like chemotaxis protein